MRSRRRALASFVLVAALSALANADADLGTFTSTLPLVFIDTHGQSITQWQKFLTAVTIIGTTNGRSSVRGPVEYHGRAEVNIRGNSSRAHPKKAYRLELQKKSGEDLKTSLLGMPAESDWILYPAFTDKTLVRDALAYELWRQMGHYAPRTKYVELFVRTNASPVKSLKGLHESNELNQVRPHRGPLPALPLPSPLPLSHLMGEGKPQERENGFPPFDIFGSWSGILPYSPLRETNGAPPSAISMADYEGVYLLVEKIKRGKNRLNIKKSKPDGSSDWFTGGYIFKKDRPNPGEHGFMSSIGTIFVYEDPKERDLAPEQKEWLRAHVNAIEYILFGDKFQDPVFGYSRYIDVDSFIDYHWITEAGKNIDGYWFSQFYHLDRGGKLKMGPIWDWDLSFGNAFYHDGYKTNGWRWERIRGPHYK